MKKLFLSILMLLVLSQPTLADYNFDGVPYTDQLDGVKKGAVKGGVYVDGGHGIGPSPYTQSFNIPEGEVKWAQLYVGVWGGSELKTGSAAVTFNNEELETLDLEGETDTNPNVYCSGHGVYWIVYDVTKNQVTGPVDAVITTGGAIDGRVYGVVLVAVYKEPEGEKVQYWINEGNVNLHGEGWSSEYATNDKAVAEFDSTVNMNKFDAARLTTVYLTGTPGLNDYLYFNDEKLCDGANCDDIADSKQSFDIKTFDVTEYLEKKANKATFERGDEDYVHPVLAVLTVHDVEPEEERSCVYLGADIKPAVSIEVTPDMLNFGTLSSGQTSSEHTLSISNTGAYTVTVTADVTDTADNLYVSGLLLDSSIWNAYATEITPGTAVDSVAVLDVLESYTGVGAKEGILMFWAQKA
jgi:subtilase family serine protease